MSNQINSGPGSPPVLTPAAPPQPPPPPPPRSHPFLKFLLGLIIAVAVGLVSIAIVVAIIGSVFEFGIESAYEEVHYGGDREAPDKIVIITLDDPIYEGTARRLIKQLKKAKKDEAVKAIVLKVDTPGGTITASDHIYREIKQLCRNGAKSKPVVVSMQSLAASGGYYISVAANKIYAEPTTLTGSIGVIAVFPNVAALLDKWGIKWEVFKSGPMKDSGSPFRPMTEQDRKRWNELIHWFFNRFLTVVVESRDIKMEELKTLATGDVFTAEEALEHKLIDAIGYLDDAIEAAKQLAKLKRAHVVEYKRPISLSELIFGEEVRWRGMSHGDFDSLFRLHMPRFMYLATPPAWPAGSF